MIGGTPAHGLREDSAAVSVGMIFDAHWRSHQPDLCTQAANGLRGVYTYPMTLIRFCRLSRIVRRAPCPQSPRRLRCSVNSRRLDLCTQAAHSLRGGHSMRRFCLLNRCACGLLSLTDPVAPLETAHRFRPRSDRIEICRRADRAGGRGWGTAASAVMQLHTSHSPLTETRGGSHCHWVG